MSSVGFLCSLAGLNVWEQIAFGGTVLVPIHFAFPMTVPLSTFQSQGIKFDKHHLVHEILYNLIQSLLGV